MYTVDVDSRCIYIFRILTSKNLLQRNTAPKNTANLTLVDDSTYDDDLDKFVATQCQAYKQGLASKFNVTPGYTKSNVRTLINYQKTSTRGRKSFFKRQFLLYPFLTVLLVAKIASHPGVSHKPLSVNFRHRHRASFLKKIQNHHWRRQS